MITCGCLHHPGKTHEEHMDAFDREQNEAQITTAMARLRAAKTYGEVVHARALLRGGMDAEIRRLKEKEARLTKEQDGCRPK